MRSICFKVQAMPPNEIVTRISGDSNFDRDWDAMRSDGDIQFAPVEVPQQAPDPPPDWLRRLFEFLGDLFSPVAKALAGGWPVIFWALVAIAAALVIYAIYRMIDPARFARGEQEAQENWAPDHGAALQLLEDADRLAAEGRYDEATHLLLQRSVGQIADIRPDLIDPSSTAREIAALPALPDSARTAFGTIAGRVERSLFALTHLDEEDWQAARNAYSQFALGYQAVAT
jgi:hypothetical protein